MLSAIYLLNYPVCIPCFPWHHILNDTLYRWWLSKEGTSWNVPIAGFEFVSGLIIFPQYNFKPQDTRNIPWCSRQQSRQLLYYMAPHCPARLLHKILVEIIEIHTVQWAFSCAQCNACLVYCVRNKQPARGQGRSTYIFDTIVSQAHFAICFPQVNTFCGIVQCSSSAALGRGTYWIMF